MFRFISTIIAASLALLASGKPDATSQPAADDVLQLLQQGNERFATGHAEHPHADRQRRLQTSREGQHPVAAIVSCSDSRVPVELIFDEGIGDLFVIRVAGNVCADHEAGSLDYAIEHFRIPVLVVMGHADCGAVTAVARGDVEQGRVPELVGLIKPAIDKVRREHPELHDSGLVNAAVHENVWHSIADLLHGSGMARQATRAGRLKIVGAVYDLASGRIEWLGPHPEQARLLAAHSVEDRTAVTAETSTTQPANRATNAAHAADGSNR